MADPAKIARAVARLAPGSIVRMGGMTDCFQPAEAICRLTYKTIRMLNERGVGYLIVTKSPMVAEERYIDVMDRRLAHIQISVTTTDDALARTYERTAPPSQRIAAVEKLQRRGFDVALRLSPFVPQLVDPGRINRVDCAKALVEFLRVNARIARRFGIDLSRYVLPQGGYRHLPLEEKLGALRRITGFDSVSVCEDVTEHYAY